MFPILFSSESEKSDVVELCIAYYIRSGDLCSSFCYVTLVDAGFIPNALKLSGNDIKGSTVTVEVARAKGAMKADKGKSPGFQQKSGWESKNNQGGGRYGEGLRLNGLDVIMKQSTARACDLSQVGWQVIGWQVIDVVFLDYEDRDAKTVFVKNLSWTTTEDSLYEHFPDAVTVRIPLNDEGKVKG